MRPHRHHEAEDGSYPLFLLAQERERNTIIVGPFDRKGFRYFMTSLQSSVPYGPPAAHVLVVIAKHVAYRPCAVSALEDEFPQKFAQKLTPDKHGFYPLVRLKLDAVTGQKHDASYEAIGLPEGEDDLCKGIQQTALHITGRAFKIRSVSHNGSVCFV